MQSPQGGGEALFAAPACDGAPLRGKELHVDSGAPQSNNIRRSNCYPCLHIRAPAASRMLTKSLLILALLVVLILGESLIQTFRILPLPQEASYFGEYIRQLASGTGAKLNDRYGQFKRVIGPYMPTIRKKPDAPTKELDVAAFSVRQFLHAHAELALILRKGEGTEIVTLSSIALCSVYPPGFNARDQLALFVQGEGSLVTCKPHQDRHICHTETGKDIGRETVRLGIGCAAGAHYATEERAAKANRCGAWRGKGAQVLCR